MQTHLIPLSSILVLDRQRRDLGDLSELAASLKKYGLIEPLVVDQNNRLIAGGRRYHAAQLLGWTEIPVVYRETLTTDELHEIELEENVRRKDMSWQERCCCIARIHNLKRKRNALEGSLWGYRETGELLGVPLGEVSLSLKLADELERDTNSELWKCETASDAQRVLLRRKQEEADKLLAEMFQKQTEESKKEETLVSIPETKNEQDSHKTSIDQRLRSILTEEGYASYVKTVAETPYLYERVREHHVSAGNTPESFDVLWKEKLASLETLDLSTILHLGDSIEFMERDSNKERFDHIITDIPYGIDMENLQQENVGMSIDSTRKEHDVKYNLELIEAFFPAAFKCLKSNSFCITWCDHMLFEWMHDIARYAGFSVQRWPFVWIKPPSSSCQNSAAQYNMTKRTEVAIICRKGNATLVRVGAPNYIIADNSDAMTVNLSHPFAKPFAVWEPLIEAVSIKGQLILEPFMGSGSGVLSLLKLQRKFVGCELNVSFFNECVEQVKKFHSDLQGRSE